MRNVTTIESTHHGSRPIAQRFRELRTTDFSTDPPNFPWARRVQLAPDPKEVVAIKVVLFKATGGGNPERDWVWRSGIGTMVLQSGISIVPWALHGNWIIFFTTAITTMLALFGCTLSYRDYRFCRGMAGRTLYYRWLRG